MTNIDHEIKVNWSEEDDCFIAISEHYDTVLVILRMKPKKST